MKKLLAVLLAVSVLFALSSAAFAEESGEVSDIQTVEVSYVELSLDDWNYVNGQFVTLSNIGLSIWIPDSFVEYEVTDEEYDAGTLVKLGDDDLSLTVQTLGIEVDSLTDWLGYIVSQGFSYPTLADINGLDAVLYNAPAMDVQVVSFRLTNGDILEFYFYPASNPDNADFMRAMICSLNAD